MANSKILTLVNSIKDIRSENAELVMQILKKLNDEPDKNKLALKARKIINKKVKAFGDVGAEDKYRLEQKYNWLRCLRETYRLRAFDFFEDYLIFLEWDREPSARYYLPRRKAFKDKLVAPLQALEDGELSGLSVSMPPRVGKSTMGIFFITWTMGRHPMGSSLMSGHSGILTDSFFDEALSIIRDDITYNFAEVFPKAKFAQSGKKDSWIDLKSLKRYHTLTCRSIGGTLTGAVEASEYEYMDDMVEGMEEALNHDRLQKKWDIIVNNFLDRRKSNCKLLMIGTMWSPDDPIARLIALHENDPTFKVVTIPALDDEGNSNFDFDYGVGYSTEDFNKIKVLTDDATWRAKYMCAPVVREGLLIDEDNCEFYNGVLPQGEPDRIICACDVAWGGGDSLAMPILYEYDDKYYLHDVVFSKGKSDITQPLVVSKLATHMPTKIRFESNNGGGEYAKTVNKMLVDRGVYLNILNNSKFSTKKKESRIIEMSSQMEHLVVYRDKASRSKEYNRFMEELFTYSVMGKNAHDDAPDALAQALKFATRATHKMATVPDYKILF